MHYIGDLIITTASREDSPNIVKIPISPGVITKIGVESAPGISGSCRAKVTLGEDQLAPSLIGTSYTLRGYPIIGAYRYPLFPKENLIKGIGWSLGSNYEHRVTFSIEVIPFYRMQRDITAAFTK